MSDDKNFSVIQVVKAAVKAGKELPPDGFGKLLLPPDLSIDEETRRLAEAYLPNCSAWINHAVRLLQPAELDINTAHNKVKHGLAVRGRADLKVTATIVGPNQEGNMPLSAFDPDVSHDVLARPVLEFLARPRLANDRTTQGLEITSLELDYQELLRDASMFAIIYGALFHVAAHRHFAGRELPNGTAIAAHPGLFGENPKPNDHGYQTGVRIPITTPPSGGSARPAIICYPDGTIDEVTFGTKTTGRVVADDEEPGHT